MIVWIKCNRAQLCLINALIHTSIYLVLTNVSGSVLGTGDSKMKNSSGSALREPTHSSLGETDVLSTIEVQLLLSC